MTLNKRLLRHFPDMTQEQEQALNEAFSSLAARLDALEAKPVDRQTQTSDFTASEGQTITVEAPSAGVNCALVPATSFNKGKRVTFIQKNANPVRFRAINGTVNGVSSVVSLLVGTYDAVSDGRNGWLMPQLLTATGALPPVLVSKTVFFGADGQDGQEGPQGFPGRDGATGATGPTGPSGSGSGAPALAPFCFEPDVAVEPGEFIPRGFASTLASNPRSGGSNVWIDPGQFMTFGLDHLTSNAQIRSGDVLFRVQGASQLQLLGDVSSLLTGAAAASSVGVASGITLQTGSAARVVIASTGEWTTPAGSSGQVLTHQGAGTPPVWAAASAGARDALLPLLTAIDENPEPAPFVPIGFMGALAGGVEGGLFSPALQGGATSAVGGHYLVRGTTSGQVALSLGGIGNGGDVQAPNGNLALTASVALQLTAGSNVPVVHGAGGTVSIVGTGGAGAFLTLQESTASTPSLSASIGMFWVRSDTPNIPMFTDDTNVDVPVKRCVARLALRQTVTNSTTVTDSTGTFTLPANTVVVGSTYFCKFRLRFDRGATLTALSIDVSFDFCGASLATPAGFATSVAASFFGYVDVEARVTVLTIGAAGTCSIDLAVHHTVGTGGTLAAVYNTAAAAAINTTISQVARGSSKMGTAVAACTLTMLGGNIDWLSN